MTVRRAGRGARDPDRLRPAGASGAPLPQPGGDPLMAATGPSRGPARTRTGSPASTSSTSTDQTRSTSTSCARRARSPTPLVDDLAAEQVRDLQRARAADGRRSCRSRRAWLTVGGRATCCASDRGAGRLLALPAARRRPAHRPATSTTFAFSFKASCDERSRLQAGARTSARPSAASTSRSTTSRATSGASAAALLDFASAALSRWQDRARGRRRR